ncbi:uncharacterized protein Bfra_009357 [Botrytis fragariae]|uniref:Uncharacterized protein n=1 Tax=Botrytis fragariae TaxID=1964551 RepID=A0A8H6AN39_9HELO|nr:uncharacterized protein Bfra_009357 [Botrytis fragariae]KAF5870803.1 hypothetical protein Bfra_009357 [Botrytis fragariae]
MLIALKANLEPTVLVNLGMGLLVLILAFAGACCRQVYTKHVAKEPLLLTVEPKSVKFIKTEVETEMRFNESQNRKSLRDIWQYRGQRTIIFLG